MRQIKKKNKKQINLDYIDIREVLNDLGIFYTESGKNVSDGWIGVTCPLPGCNDESNHLGICLDSPVISCFACGKSGNYLTYLTHELKSFSKACAILEKHSPVELKRKDKKTIERAVKVELPFNATTQIRKIHKKFLKHRKFNWKELQIKYNLHYCDNDNFWENRIIVPVYKNKQLITFTSVDTDFKSQMRYKHLRKEDSIIPVKQHLIGLEHTNRNAVIVVEGLLDMYRIGFGAVCTSGTQVTSEQIMELSKFQRVIILFDGDTPGRLASDKLAFDLSPFTDVVQIFLPDGIDPDKMKKKDIKEIREMIGRH